MRFSVHIPFIKTFLSETARINVVELLASADTASNGKFSRYCQEILKEIHRGAEVFLTPSCSDALEMASILIGLKEGDEVILPSFHFPSAANAIVNFGATPVFVDVTENCCIDANQVEKVISSKTRAISWVNYGGQAPDLLKLRDIADTNEIFLIEDNAHSLGVDNAGTRLGTFGHFSVTSFHYTKNIQCGEGGALIVNDKKFLDRSHIVYEKGTNRRDFSLGRISKYCWVDKGSSYVMSEVSAAILSGQLEEMERINAERSRVTKTYIDYFESHEEIHPFRFEPEIEKQFAETAHLIPLLINQEGRREKISNYLKGRGIVAVSHYETLHSSPMAVRILEATSGEFRRRTLRGDAEFPMSQSISNSIIRLPIWPEMDNDTVVTVCEHLSRAIKESF